MQNKMRRWIVVMASTLMVAGSSISIFKVGFEYSNISIIAIAVAQMLWFYTHEKSAVILIAFELFLMGLVIFMMPMLPAEGEDVFIPIFPRWVLLMLGGIIFIFFSWAASRLLKTKST